ncbi:unnamed protein product [Mytilus coruscus]|uniref:Reverse transcriptase domain-containing protein n=1 Tax=Mytilus coruscus TaxID=42192 RepID=A0A6J8BHV5_MYTCO|nr:unnamed protein product [Mytilus coruscus]
MSAFKQNGHRLSQKQMPASKEDGSQHQKEMTLNKTPIRFHRNRASIQKRPMPASKETDASIQRRQMLAYKEDGCQHPKEMTGVKRHLKEQHNICLIEFTYTFIHEIEYYVQNNATHRERCEEAYQRKKEKYTELMTTCRERGWKAWLFPVEVGCRGFPAQSVWRMLQAMGIVGKARKTAVRQLGEAAERSSCWLWHRRDDLSWKPSADELEPSEDIKAPAESDRDSEMKEDEQSREYDSRKAEYHHLSNATTRKRKRTTTQMVQTTLTGEKAEAKCHCGKICKNQRGLKIHQSRSGCSRGIVTEQRTDLSGETQENPSQDTNHSARNLSASVTSHDSSQSLNGEEHITQQRQETSHQKERIAWPKMNSEAQWRDLNDDLGVILETSLQGCVERRIETLTSLIYNIGKERFGVEERKEKSNTKQTPNRREQKIKQLRKELKDLNRRYKKSNEIEKLGIACITDSVSEELRRTRRAKQLKNSNKKKAKNRANFIKNPYNYTKTLLGGERTGHLHCSKEEVEKYLHETHSDKERETPLGYCPRVEEEEQPTIEFETKEPTWKEVCEVVKKARTGSAPGYSGVPYKVYKKCPKILRKLWQLFRTLWKKGIIPESWQKAEGCFVPKEKDSKDISQFRTISLLSVEEKSIYLYWQTG